MESRWYVLSFSLPELGSGFYTSEGGSKLWEMMLRGPKSQRGLRSHEAVTFLTAGGRVISYLSLQEISLRSWSLRFV